jgi:NADPH:quinone reductase-like Zn-dependent oxidoreductase
MRAFTLDGFDTQPSLRDLPEPDITAEELLVNVHASSVNPVDAFIAAGYLQQYSEYEFPVTLGRDFAGVVERVGSGVTAYAAGDEVFGYVRAASPNVHRGSWADLIAVPEDVEIVAKPRNIDFAHAGAAGLTGVSAIAAFDALALTERSTVLVVGAAGGVGSLFIQLAASAGAHVIAAAAAEDEDFLRELGVAEIVDRSGDVAAAVREAHPDGVDAILDVVSQEPDASLLKSEGRLASTLAAAGDGPGRSNVMAEPTRANLQRLAELLDAGTLRVYIQRSDALDEAAEALGALQATHTQGKLGLSIA